MRPGRLIVLVFLFIILLGAGLLCLPAASRSGEPTPFLTSLFTATSATCVTGLIRVDTGTHWAMFGQVVILLLIQIGGLGFMTIACLFFFALRRKIGLRERMVLAQALGSDSYSGIVSLVRNILRGTAAVEGAGALILFFRFLPEFGFGKALWYGVFHSISAFCNAGFDVLADTDVGGSLCRYATDPVVNFTIMALIIIGGLGFAVWGDIRHNRRFSRMSVYTRLVILIARGRTSVQIMKRRIPQQAVANASALFILVLLLSGLGAAFLSIADHVSLENALYETISALCTVGLTTGITSSLCAASQIVLIIFMFFGRLGIMTISVGFMAADRAEERVSYAETKIMIG